MPARSSPEASAIVVVEDAILAASLELSLVAGGLCTVIHDPARGLDSLPLETAMTLVAGPTVFNADAKGFVAGLRARGWNGLIVLITGDGEALRKTFVGADRVVVLEMPFVGADLIGAIRKVWPAR